MDIDEIIAIYYIYDGYIKKKMKKKYWIHPFLQTRDETRHFDIFVEKIKKYNEKSFGYLIMNLKSFEELLSILKMFITKEDTRFRKSIKLEEMQTIVLK